MNDMCFVRFPLGLVNVQGIHAGSQGAKQESGEQGKRGSLLNPIPAPMILWGASLLIARGSCIDGGRNGVKG